MRMYFLKWCQAGGKQHLLANYPLLQIAAEQKDLNMRILSASVLSLLCLVFINNPDHFGFMSD